MAPRRERSAGPLHDLSLVLPPQDDLLEKIALINLGCPKNLVDAEVMCGHLAASGYQLTTDPAGADVVVVNTCGFLQASAQEAVDTLLEVSQWKQEGRC